MALSFRNKTFPDIWYNLSKDMYTKVYKITDIKVRQTRTFLSINAAKDYILNTQLGKGKQWGKKNILVDISNKSMYIRKLLKSVFLNLNFLKSFHFKV